MKKLTVLLLLLSGIFFAGCTPQEMSTPEVEIDIEAEVEKAVQEYLAENPVTPVETSDHMSLESFSDDLSALVDKVDSSTVLVANINENTGEDSSGSAVVYKEESGEYYAVTNNHVVEDHTELRIYFKDHLWYPAELVGTDPDTDVAVIKFSTDVGNHDITVVHFGDKEDLERGQVVIALGSPGGLEYYNSVTMGIISGLERFIGLEDLDGDGYDDIFVKMLQTDAAINPGNSGGPLFNLNGEIVGINTIKLVSDDIEGMGFSIYIDVVQRVVEDLETLGYVQKTRFGVWIQDARYAPEVPEGVSLGVIVQEVIEGEPAAMTSDLQAGDVIIEMAGIQVDSIERLKDIIFQYHPGDEVEFKYYRDGEILTSSVVLGEAN